MLWPGNPPQTQAYHARPRNPITRVTRDGSDGRAAAPAAPAETPLRLLSREEMQCTPEGNVFRAGLVSCRLWGGVDEPAGCEGDRALTVARIRRLAAKFKVRPDTFLD